MNYTGADLCWARCDPGSRNLGFPSLGRAAPALEADRQASAADQWTRCYHAPLAGASSEKERRPRIPGHCAGTSRADALRWLREGVREAAQRRPRLRGGEGWARLGVSPGPVRSSLVKVSFLLERKPGQSWTCGFLRGCPFAGHSCFRAPFLGTCLTFPGKGGNKSPSLVADC